MKYAYAIFDPKDRCFTVSAGYYGNSYNLLAFEHRADAVQYIKSHNLTNFTVRRVGVK